MNKKLLIISLLLVLAFLTINNKKIKLIGMELYNKINGAIRFYTSKQTAVLSQAATSLLKAGLPKEKLQFVLPQLAFETGHFKSDVLNKDNNLSGITFVGQAGATKGVKMPAADSLTGYYAHFNSVDDWAKDYLRIMNKVGKYRPLEATNIQDFSHRLKLNKYYQADEKTYTNGLISIQNIFKPLFNSI